MDQSKGGEARLLSLGLAQAPATDEKIGAQFNQAEHQPDTYPNVVFGQVHDGTYFLDFIKNELFHFPLINFPCSRISVLRVGCG